MFDVSVPISPFRSAVFRVTIDPSTETGLRARIRSVVDSRGSRKPLREIEPTDYVLTNGGAIAIVVAHSALLTAGCEANEMMPEA